MSAGAEETVAGRPGGRTLHLTPEPVWTAQADADTYRPQGFDAEGFIHCTNGEVNLLTVANAFYQADRHPYLVLDIDLDRVTAPVRYDDPDRLYPHIYGSLNRDAVRGVRRAIRLADGSFADID